MAEHDTTKGNPPPDATADRELLTRVQARDTQAENALCARYRAELTKLAEAILHNMPDADDCVSLTLAKSMKYLQSGKAPTNFEAWITTVCRNTACDLLEKRRNRNKVESLFGSGDCDQSDPAPSPLAVLATHAEMLPSEETRLAIAAAFGHCRKRLTQALRKVLVLRYGLATNVAYTFDEISKLMSSPKRKVESVAKLRKTRTPTVKNQLSNARKRLWQCIRDQMYREERASKSRGLPR